jgi:hypothetical protein
VARTVYRTTMECLGEVGLGDLVVTTVGYEVTSDDLVGEYRAALPVPTSRLRRSSFLELLLHRHNGVLGDSDP